MATVSAARMAAFRILLTMERSRNAHCDDLLRAPAMDALSPADRNLTTALVMGTLRWQLALDAVAAQYLQRKSRPDDAVAIALRIGVFQLLLMDRIPAHAALSESVELTKINGHPHAAGMVNAVLRRVAESASTIHLDPAAAHPPWMTKRWRRNLGGANTAAITAYNQQPPAATLRLDTAIDTMSEALPPGHFLNRARILPPGTAVPEGARIQDEGSQLVAELAGKVTRVGARILDCCAAPGGKTAILAENNPQADITACDISEARLRTMQRSFAASPRTASIHCVVADATALPFRDDFDLILCDAPCSGTGTVARNPEIKLRLDVSDLARQQERQIAILRSAYGVLAPGGRLIYSTCSLEPEENAAVVEALLAAEHSAQQLDVEDRLTVMRDEGTLHADGFRILHARALRERSMLTLPGTLPCDGFFAAILTRAL